MVHWGKQNIILRWCRARNLFRSQILVTTGGLNCESLVYDVVT